MKKEEYMQRITVDPQFEEGEPCVRGLPIRVSDIISKFACGLSIPQILVEHPELTHEDFMACLAYAVDEESGKYLY